MDLSALGPAGAAVVIVFLFLRFMKDAFERLITSVDKNTAVTNETLKFLKNLNGDLKRSVQKKIN